MKPAQSAEPVRPASFLVFEPVNAKRGGTPVRPLQLREALAAADAGGPTRLSDVAFTPRRGPVALRLVQSLVLDYEGAMAEYQKLDAAFRREVKALEGLTEVESKAAQRYVNEAWAAREGQWATAHWYVLEDFLRDGRTVGAAASYFEALHREGEIVLYP